MSKFIYKFPILHSDMVKLMETLEDEDRYEFEGIAKAYGQYTIVGSSYDSSIRVFLGKKCGNFHGPSKYQSLVSEKDIETNDMIRFYGIPEDYVFVSKKEWEEYPEVKLAKMESMLNNAIEDVLNEKED